MRRAHAVALSLVLTGGSVAGVLAATRTARLASTQPQSSRPDPSLTARSRKLDRLEASLRRALASQPPALPPVPRYAPVPIPALPPLPASPAVTHTVAETPAPAPAQPAPPAPAASAPAGKVVYVRPKPVVEYVRPAPVAAPAVRPGRGEDGESGENGLGEGDQTGGEGGSVLAEGRPSLDQGAAFDGGEE